MSVDEKPDRPSWLREEFRRARKRRAETPRHGLPIPTRRKGGA